MTRSPSTSVSGGPLVQALSARNRRSEPRPHDFRRPSKLSREHLRVLQIAQEAYARQGTTALTSLLRTGARLDLQETEQVGYDDYVSTLPNPVFIATFTLDPLPGKGMLAIPLDVAMACVDHMLGGSGTGHQPERPMTGMESQVIGVLLDRLFSEFASAFTPIAAMEPVLAGLEYNPALAQTAAGSETVMVSRYTLRAGLRECTATMCLPFSSFAAALKAAASPAVSDADRVKREEAAQALATRLREVPVEVAVRFGTLRLPSSDLTSVAVGDVIPLGHPTASPLEVTTNGVVFAYAMSGSHRRRLVGQIVQTPTTEKKDH